MKTAITEPIATRAFVLTKPGGEQVSIVLVVGRPYMVDAVESRCPVRIDGLDGQYNDISGSDTFQALCLALKFLKLRVDDQIASGCRLTDPGFDHPYEAHDLAPIFGVAAIYPVPVPPKRRTRARGAKKSR